MRKFLIRAYVPKLIDMLIEEEHKVDGRMCLKASTRSPAVKHIPNKKRKCQTNPGTCGSVPSTNKPRPKASKWSRKSPPHDNNSSSRVLIPHFYGVKCKLKFQ